MIQNREVSPPAQETSEEEEDNDKDKDFHVSDADSFSDEEPPRKIFFKEPRVKLTRLSHPLVRYNLNNIHLYEM